MSKDSEERKKSLLDIMQKAYREYCEMGFLGNGSISSIGRRPEAIAEDSDDEEPYLPSGARLQVLESTDSFDEPVYRLILSGSEACSHAERQVDFPASVLVSQAGSSLESDDTLESYLVSWLEDTDTALQTRPDEFFKNSQVFVENVLQEMRSVSGSDRFRRLCWADHNYIELFAIKEGSHLDVQRDTSIKKSVIIRNVVRNFNNLYSIGEFDNFYVIPSKSEPDNEGNMKTLTLPLMIDFGSSELVWECAESLKKYQLVNHARKLANNYKMRETGNNGSGSADFAESEDLDKSVTASAPGTSPASSGADNSGISESHMSGSSMADMIRSKEDDVHAIYELLLDTADLDSMDLAELKAKDRTARNIVSNIYLSNSDKLFCREFPVREWNVSGADILSKPSEVVEESFWSKRSVLMTKDRNLVRGAVSYLVGRGIEADKTPLFGEYFLKVNGTEVFFLGDEAKENYQGYVDHWISSRIAHHISKGYSCGLDKDKISIHNFDASFEDGEMLELYHKSVAKTLDSLLDRYSSEGRDIHLKQDHIVLGDSEISFDAEMVGFYERQADAWLDSKAGQKYLSSPKGRAWSESPEGRTWYEGHLTRIMQEELKRRIGGAKTHEDDGLVHGEPLFTEDDIIIRTGEIEPLSDMTSHGYVIDEAPGEDGSDNGYSGNSDS